MATPKRSFRPEFFAAPALVCFLLGISLFFFRGRLDTTDEIQMFLTSMSIAESGSLVWAQEYEGMRFSGYGAGTPIVGVPSYILNRALGEVLPDSVRSLAPLTNAVLFGFLGLMAALCLTGERRWWAVAVVMTFSPLLPASLTFFSEPLAALGLVAATVGFLRPRLWLLTLLGAVAAISARSAMAPFVGLVLLWGLLEGGSRKALVAGFLGMLLGLGATLLQNTLLRGNPFMTGYVGQDFTTPAATGLYGLLVSPERGVLIFWPMLLMPYVFAPLLSNSERGILRLACAAGIGSLALHALFWTWHGGWTSGPRFLLPALALHIAPAAAALLALGRADMVRRGLFWLALGWSALMAFIYAMHAPNDWWNMLWGFHQTENQWLFIPQLSLWQAWLQGVPVPTATAPLPVDWRAGQLAVVTLLCVVPLYPLLQPWRGHVGTDPEAIGEPPLPGPGINWSSALGQPSPVLFVLVCVWISALLGLLAGPRGWRDVDSTGGATHPYLFLNGEAGRFEGWIDYPLDGPVLFHARANALYRVYINEVLVLEQMEPLPQHLPRFEASLRRGQNLIRVEVFEKEPALPPVFQLYWTWPGGGQYLTPVGGQWVTPEPVEGWQKAIRWVHRRELLFFAAILGLLIIRPARKRGNSRR